MRRSNPLLAGLCLAAFFCAGTASSFAMSVIAPTFSELVAKAETVARVEVVSQSSQWDTSVSGQKVIHTYVQCRVIKQLKGAEQTTLSLRFLGGQVDGAVMQIPDMPTFVTGRRYIVFVAANGRAFCPLVGVMHGTYSLAADSAGIEHVRRSNGAALRSTAEVTQSDETMDLTGESGMKRDDFEQAITEEMHHASTR